MSNAKLSAFAKRRRLNDGSAVEASGSDSSVSGAIKTKITTAPKKSRQREAIQAQPLVLESPEDEHEGAFEGNSFEPLVEAQVVKFNGIREIEDLGRKSCKVRLSRGQECSFVGVVKLWVRDGSVKVYGATLHESSTVYTIFAPYVENPIIVRSVSKVAEFQLESIEKGDLAEPSCLNVPSRLRSRLNDLSFRIIDFEVHSSVASKPTSNQGEYFEQLSKNLTSVKDICVLVCGKRSSATADASLRLINAMLSNRKGSDLEKGVAFLDLDQSIPTHTTPGTISLIYHKEFILGPGHAYPLIESTKTSKLVSSTYIGCLNYDGGAEAWKFIENMFKTHPELRTMPLVVRTGKWLATASAGTLSILRKVLPSSSVLCVDRTKSSPFHEASLALVEKESEPQHVPEFSTHVVPSLVEHRHSLRSHFMFHKFNGHVPTWYGNIVDLLDARRLEFSINPSKPGVRFLLLSGGMVRLDDLSDLLADSLVTIVARDSRNSDHGSAFEIQPFQQNLNLYSIGLAYVENLDETAGTIKVVTNITQALLDSHYSAGRSVGLVLEKPGPEGQFSRHMLRD